MKASVTAFKTRKNQQVVKPIFLYEICYNKTSNLWLYYANFPTDVIFAGKTYIQYGIGHDSISESLDGSSVKVELTIGNVNRVIQYYLEMYNGLRDAQVNILQVFQEELTNPLAVDQITLYVADVSVNSREARFVLSTKFDVFDITLPRRKYYRGYCSHVFKDAGCGYSGGETACDKTMARCQVLGNIHRFGAFPAIPQRDIYKVNVSTP